MALSASHQVSGTHQPAYNDNLWVVDESSTAITSNFNFKFICDIKNGSGTLLNRLKAPIHYSSSDEGVFNISRILGDYVTYDWDYNDTAASGCSNSVFDYILDFGYEYSTGATSPIEQTLAELTVTGNTVWNGSLHPLDFLDYDEANYMMGTGSSANFLTSLTSKRIHENQKDWIFALNNSDLDHLYVDFSGGGSTTITSPTSDIVRFPIGANIPGGIPTGVTSYTIEPRDSSSGSVGSSFTIKIDDRCSKYESVDLFFLNKYGAVESFRFDRVRRDNFSVNRKDYRKNPYTLSGGAYSYDRLEHSKSTYYSEMTQRTTLNSNNITEVEAEWLKQLINSPRVWMYDTALVPINIATSEYEQRYHVNDKVFNLTLEVEHSFVDKAQIL